MSNPDKFLLEVLGASGTEALNKATRRSPALAQVLLPRAILSWAKAICCGYSGPVPGLDNSFFDIHKSDSDGYYTGSMSVGEKYTQFVGSSLFGVSAQIAVALGLETVSMDSSIKDMDITNLGKSVDALAWSRMLAKSRQEISKPVSIQGAYHIYSGKNGFEVRRHADGKIIADNFRTAVDAEKFALDRNGADDLGDAQGHHHHLNKATLDPNAGYKISHEHHDLGNGNMMTKVNVHSPTGEHVGAATFNHTGNTLTPGTVVVDEDHQRKGIASAMYSHAQKHTGKSIVPSANQTPEGAALWSGNKQNPQFGLGKTDLPGTTARPTKQLEAIAPEKATMQQANRQPPRLDGKGPGVKAPKRTDEKVPGLPSPKAFKPKPPPALKVSKSESMTPCHLCGHAQFGGDGGFYGCVCFSDLAKNTVIRPTRDSYLVIFGPEWTEDARAALLEALRG
jgi:predicted GNAT family acetyltransferase